MVSLDKNRRLMAVPEIVPQTDDEKRRFKEGRARAKQRRELREKKNKTDAYV
jgi:acyl-CoA hydrolase